MVRQRMSQQRSSYARYSTLVTVFNILVCSPPDTPTCTKGCHITEKSQYGNAELGVFESSPAAHHVRHEAFPPPTLALHLFQLWWPRLHRYLTGDTSPLG